MQCIDFDQHFSEYVEAWMDQTRNVYRNMDEMEAQMPDVYMKWLNTPVNWLNGCTPGMYFAQFDQADMLVDWLRKYAKERVSPPEVLVERIAGLGDDAAQPLIALASDESAPLDARMTALSIIGEIQPKQAVDALVEIMVTADERELIDAATDALKPLSYCVVAPCLARYESAPDDTKENFLDVLCNFSGEKSIYPLLEDAFLSWNDKRALIASYMGKLGDARAVDFLKEAAQWEDLHYLDFLEMRSAIEALGGEMHDVRDFTGDPYYESLKKMG